MIKDEKGDATFPGRFCEAGEILVRPLHPTIFQI